MLWILFALLTACAEAIRNAFQKRVANHEDAFVTAAAVPLYSLPFLIIALFVVGIPEFDPGLWITVGAFAIVSAIGFICFALAIKKSGLSDTIPMLAFSPAFMLIAGPLLLGEQISLIGGAGMLLIVTGAYLLHIKDISKGIFGPIKALFHDVGARLMLITAILWTFTSILQKIGVEQSSPVAFATLSFSASALVLVSIASIEAGKKRHQLYTDFRGFVPIGFFAATMILLWMLALSYGTATYALPMRRTAILFSVLIGGLVFREKNLKDHALGASVMILGAVLISLA